MTPFLYEELAKDRIATRRQQSEDNRMARAARTDQTRRSSQHPILDAVGHGLIAIGARLVDNTPTGDEPLIPRAA